LVVFVLAFPVVIDEYCKANNDNVLIAATAIQDEILVGGRIYYGKQNPA
jgi:hypothetical protein